MLPADEAIAIYEHLVTVLQAIFCNAVGRGECLEHAIRQAVSSAMPKTRTYRYSIEIKDAEGLSVLFTVADWDEADRRIAVSQILRLDGVLEVKNFAKPQRSAETGQ